MLSTYKIVSNNCIGGTLMKQQNKQYESPFAWVTFNIFI